LADAVAGPGRARLLAAAALGAVFGATATLWAVRSDEPAAPRSGAAAPVEARAPDLGPEDAAIGALRVTVDTGSVNGAGTDRPVLLWLDNRPHALSDAPRGDFAPGATATATLRGSGVPVTLGALRRASILLTVDLGRSAIATSWYCARAALEVRLEGSAAWVPYLERRDVGWLSLDEPPRRSPAYALQ